MESQETPSSDNARKPKPEHASGPAKPVRVKQSVYQGALRQILSKSDGAPTAVKLADRALDKVEQSVLQSKEPAVKKMSSRFLRLTIEQDMRVAVCDFIASTTESTDLSHLKRLPFLLWHIEKRMLMTHWSTDEEGFEERRAQTGSGMSQFLQESLIAEGLINI